MVHHKGLLLSRNIFGCFARRLWNQTAALQQAAPSSSHGPDAPFVRQVPPDAEPDQAAIQQENDNAQKMRRRILALSHPIDISLEGIRSWAQRNQWQDHVKRYTFDLQTLENIGPELAAAYFFVARGGAIKFSTSKHWNTLGKDANQLGVTAKSENQLMSIMPKEMQPGQAVEAVVVRGLPLVYESFAALACCSNLRYLDISYCEHVDDWCLSRLHHCHKSLRHLNISGCKKVTDRGVAQLYQLRSLRRLVMHDLPQVTGNQLFMLQLEHILPGCFITPQIEFKSAPEKQQEEIKPKIVEFATQPPNK